MTEEAEDPVAAPAYRVRALVDSEQLQKDLSFSPNNLTDAMMQQASMFVHYGTLASKASRQVDDLKMLLEIAESKVDKAIRNKAVDDGEKLTEALITKRISAHSKIVELTKLLNEAKQIEKLCAVAVEGFRHRRDMLVQTGLLAREEMKGEVSIARRQEAEDAATAQRERVLARLNSGAAA